MPLTRPTLLLLIAVVAMTGCSDNTNTSTTTPTPTITETFSGTLTVNGAVTHQFSATARGTVTATLTSVGPDNTVLIGVSLGTWNGTSCQVIIANDQTAQGAGVLGTVSGVGNLCLRVYDVGKLTAPVTYSIDVVHP
jgi:hypothetical protein